MNNNEAKVIADKLNKITPIEQEQIKKGLFISDIPDFSTRIIENKLELLTNYFFKKQDLYISKHNRFANYPLHAHQFTELNYMLTGSCHQLINGSPIVLNQGELLLIGTGVSHEIKALGEKDILINILFKKSSITFEWLSKMGGVCNPLIQYLTNLSIDNGRTDQYIIFRVSQVQDVQDTLSKMIDEYYSADAYSSTIAELYLPILFTALTRNCNSPIPSVNPLRDNQKILPVLQLIEENFKEINLSKAAEQLGYNKTYLGNLIKKTAGVTFTQLVVKRRLYQARLLLSTTNLPICDVAQESGFSNKTYFYKVFKKAFGYLPGEERKKEGISSLPDERTLFLNR